jgi:hypothetical protein
MRKLFSKLDRTITSGLPTNREMADRLQVDKTGEVIVAICGRY